MNVLGDTADTAGDPPAGAPASTARWDPAAGGPSRPPGPGGSAGSAPDADRRDGRTDLRRRRDALAEQVTELHWDLGGLAYEMAIRDHFRLDVLVRRAALLQERDAELAEVERLLAMEDSASVGDCPSCGAPHSRGAVYCWQCGLALMERAAPAGPGADSATVAPVAIDGVAPGSSSSGGMRSGANPTTAAMDALLAPSASARLGAASPANEPAPGAGPTEGHARFAPGSSPDR
jgi:hypothetical protein